MIKLFKTALAAIDKVLTTRIAEAALAVLMTAVIALAATAQIQHAELKALRASNEKHLACVAALAPKSIRDPAPLCEPAILADHAAAGQARACEDALQATPENGFGVQQACLAGTKRAIAARDAAAHDRDSLKSQLASERASQAAAIGRAQAAARTDAERKARAQAAVDAAPRDGDGLVVCAADCLRARWPAASSGARP